MTTTHFYAKDRAAWRAWLSSNHNKESAVWLVYDKGPDRRLAPSDIPEVALCFGWIDSVPGKVDNKQAKIYVAKRKPKSPWSRVNKERVSRLINSGEMTAAGLAAIEVAKANGSWDTLNDSDNLVIPPELTAALASNQAAREHFSNFPRGSQKIILEWINAAKRPETRAARISETVELAAQNIRAHHWRQ